MKPTSFAPDDLISEMTAKALLEIGAVNFRADEPFKLASGLASPVYIDCRKLISFPRLRTTLMDFCTTKILRDIGYEKIDVIAGGETAGIPFGAWISDNLDLPMNYVRKKPKGYGKDAQIEGDSIEGKRVILVEDLTTDGGSKINFCNAIREAGGEIADTIVLFYYDIFPDALKNMDQIGLKLHYLATWRDVLTVCHNKNYFDVETLKQVEKFLDSPLEWSGAHGGATQITSV